MKIAVLSDTHGYLDDKILSYLEPADEIWHAGDIGDIAVIDRLEQLSGRLRAVSGNIDNHQIRQAAPAEQVFTIEKTKVLIIHIAGSPPRYNKLVKQQLQSVKPNILVCGHSHILKVMNDQANNLLFVNPGAVGHHGFHKMRTLILFEIVNGKPQDMKVIELGRRGRVNLV
jgi:uncharacterized protein